jgi:hypothetical protein
MAITDKVRRALWASSGGFCQNPECRKEFVRFFQTGEVTHLDELAHVIARSRKGPRGASSEPQSARDSFDRIIVLCPTCHTLVDKNPKMFPADLLLRWKKQHRSLLKAAFAPSFDNKKELRDKLEELLARNKALFDAYGPFSEHAEKPITDAARMWHQAALSDLIPNNRLIVQLLNGHRKHLSRRDSAIAEQFRIHTEAFEYNHLSGDKFPEAPLFPKKICTILH